MTEPSDELRLGSRRHRKATPMATRRIGHAFTPAMAGGAPAAAADFPGFLEPDQQDTKRTWITGSLASLLHFGLLAVVIFLASLAAEEEDDIITVALIPAQPDEPAPAPRVLAERRSLDFAPALQAVAPQIVNPRVVANAAPAVAAESLQMDALSSVTAPTQIQHSATVVERVSAVTSIATARASAVDVSDVGGPAVRGPTRVNAPVGPSVGPRQVVAAAPSTTTGTGTLAIGGGSSVREGVLSNRDVQGHPNAPVLVRVDTAIGDSFKRGAGGTGTGRGAVGQVSDTDCINRPEVQRYLASVEERTMARWTLPRGLSANKRVTLRFQLDVAGSAAAVELVRTEDNALGASAVDALRAASPFPPMSEAVRCLSRSAITATFSNPGAG